MRRLLIFGFALLAVVFAGCSGGAGGDPSDDIGDIFVLSISPGNGDQLDTGDSFDGFNALNNPQLINPGAVTIVFTNSLDTTSVINNDPADPQGTQNVRLFFFDINQGPFDPNAPVVPGSNPPGANVLVNAETQLADTRQPNDTLVIRPEGISAINPLPEGQYSVIVELGVRGADGDGMKGQEFFMFFRVGQDNLGPVVVAASPAPGDRNVMPTQEIRITMSETIRASTVDNTTVSVSFQPAGAPVPTSIPGMWFTDGGNGPGNNFPLLQLDQFGNAGFSGVSPRNGADIVFRPDLTAFPVNMTAEDPFDFMCTLRTDPPRKGNTGFPLGQTISIGFITGPGGVTDTAGNTVPAGSPNTTFTFETMTLPEPIFAPATVGAVFYGDTVGVGVIDADSSRTPYLVGPNPARPPNSVVTVGQGPAATPVRVPINDLVDMTTDTRPYTSFYTFTCTPGAFPNIAMGNLYAVSGQTGGGQVVVIDTFLMTPLGTWGTPSPGGIALTAIGATGRAVVSNFSANTATVFDVGNVAWFTISGGLPATQNGLFTLVSTGATQLILSPADFTRVFPSQRQDVTSPPGPPVLGTINVGISPTKVKITGLPNSLGVLSAFCPSPFLTPDTIVCVLNAGENTADFTELQNLSQSSAIEPDLDGVNLASQPTDVTWSPLSFQTGSYYFWISSIGGSVELFATGFLANTPSVKPQASTNFAPNKIINSIGGLSQPTALQWITTGTATQTPQAYTHSVLVAETGENRIQEMGITRELPSNLFSVINSNLSSGLGPIDITGDPSNSFWFAPCGPRFTTYYVANAGEGTVRVANYLGGIIGTEIPVPGVQFVASWWSR